jgi:hypothetical protein
MDPNEALKNARRAMMVLRRIEDRPDVSVGGHDRDQEIKNDANEQLVDAFEALDGWLSKGGFTPKAWTPKADTIDCSFDD